MNADREQQMRVAQRRMLRWMLGSGRRKIPAESNDQEADTSDDEFPEPADDSDQNLGLEPWESWISRTTHQVEEQMRQCKIEDWVVCQRRR
eukprot:5771853-Karenia_brevis.AAC.1